ncbi:RDD family protein [Spiroplasma endosymbiont of Diplazon laetatorius]|uniref:RDD family protein n=1 Tax=Spiroplasma endosymbiont of Diplazon laetatorius TaxID=3066322 RepID=UPI0030D2339F
MAHQEEKNYIENSSHNLVKPHLGRIFFARLLDVVLCSVLPLVLAIIQPISNWQTFLINFSVSQLIIFSYFVLLPYFWKGNTLGKLILNLRLKKTNDEKIKMRDVFLREFYFLYIPLIFQIFVQIILGIIIYTTPKDEQNESTEFILKIINNIGYVFLAMWFIYIPLTIYLQKENLSAIDLKVKTKVFYLEKVLVITRIEKEKKHIHLQNDKPGKIDVKEIEKIIGEENE